MKVLIETHYLPSIAYFATIAGVDEVILERHEHYIKQSFRNRCYINTTHGVDTLIVPLTGKHGKVMITDVRIDYSQKWQTNHWRTIQSAYGKSPFFEFYAPDLELLYEKRHVFLYDLNHEFLTLCLKWLKTPLPVRESLTYAKGQVDGIKDVRNEINAKNPALSNKYYKSVPYNQVFGHKFVDNLSVIDLVFCAGPQSRQIVKDSVVG